MKGHMMRKFFLSIILVLVPFIANLALPWDTAYIDSLFKSKNARGSFLLYDLKADKYYKFNEARCDSGFLPASTFKIVNSLIGLETGVLSGKDHVYKWDGQKRWLDSWNQDHTLQSAIANSVVWYYQRLAREIGPERMKENLSKLDYGNDDISAGIDLFWLEGNYKVTSYEQIGLLKGLYADKLPFSKRNMKIVREIMVNDSTDAYVLRAKTGFAVRGKGQPLTGWYVGYVERGDNVYFFSLNLTGRDEDIDALFPARIDITRAILKQNGIID
jgi:beta-lactamase class D